MSLIFFFSFRELPPQRIAQTFFGRKFLDMQSMLKFWKALTRWFTMSFLDVLGSSLTLWPGELPPSKCCSRGSTLCLGLLVTVHIQKANFSLPLTALLKPPMMIQRGSSTFASVDLGLNAPNTYMVSIVKAQSKPELRLSKIQLSTTLHLYWPGKYELRITVL